MTPCIKTNKPAVNSYFGNIIQLIHSFEVNIRICQPENCDVRRDEAKVNITLEG